MILRPRMIVLALLVVFGAALLAPPQATAQPDAALRAAYVLELAAPPAAAFYTAQQTIDVNAASATTATRRYLESLEQTQQRL